LELLLGLGRDHQSARDGRRSKPAVRAWQQVIILAT
jgi:hypothetical protein